MLLRYKTIIQPTWSNTIAGYGRYSQNMIRYNVGWNRRRKKFNILCNINKLYHIWSDLLAIFRIFIFEPFLAVRLLELSSEIAIEPESVMGKKLFGNSDETRLY